MINSKREHVKINGYRGEWVVIDSEYLRGQRWYLLEHETEDTFYLVVDSDGDVLTETYDDLTCALYDTFGALRLDRGPFGC